MFNGGSAYSMVNLEKYSWNLFPDGRVLKTFFTEEADKKSPKTQHEVLLEQQTMDSVTQIQTPLKMHGEKCLV